ncbi:ATP-binding protein [candidate division KSB1 bacterium]
MKKRRIKVSCRSNNLEHIRKFVSEAAKSSGFSESEVDKIELAVDEASANVVNHAYEVKEGKEIDVEVKVDNEKFTVLVRDKGKGFDPANINLPDMNNYLKTHKVGGLGIHLMKVLMDEVKFDFKPGHKNQVIMVKYLKK